VTAILEPASSPQGPGIGGIWHPERRRLTSGLVLIVSLTAFEALAVATALPVAIGDIGGVRFYGWAFSSFMLANLVGIQAAGEAADRHGAQRPFAAGSALFAAGLLTAGLSPGILVFIAGRVLQGFGAGAISSAAYVAVARAYPSGARPRMLAVLSSAWVIPGMVGPAAAGALTHLFGWRSVFLSLLPLVAAALLLAAPPLHRLAAAGGDHDPAARTGPAVRLAVGTGLALWAIEALPALTAWLAFVVGVVVAVPGFRRLLPAGVTRARAGLPAAVATLGLASAAFFGAEAYVPLALTAVRGQSMLVAGAALTAATLCWTAGTWVQERLVHRLNRRALACSGLLLIIAGVVGTSAVLAASVPVELGPIMWGVAGLGMGVAYPTAMLVALEGASRGREGESSAAMQLANVFGTALGTGMGGGLLALAASAGYPTAIGIGAADAFALAVGLVGLGAAGRLPRAAAAEHLTVSSRA
jgi:MFS family permease